MKRIFTHTTPKKFFRFKSDENVFKQFSKTLNLPKTNFSMRSNSEITEPNLQKICCDYIYEKQKNLENKKEFTLHDGPPYANGNLHIGHSLNKVLKDIICRYKILQGYKVNFIPGWDCHGLPIEMQFSNSKINDPLEIRKKCAEFATSQIENQMKDFKRWGVLGDWDNIYTTMKPEYEASQLKIFLEMYKKGLIYKGFRPVYWSPSNQTALAEAELEYPENHISKSIFVSFKMRTKENQKIENDFTKKYKNIGCLIWTTTPWTIVSNQAVCFNENFDYSIIRWNDEHFIVASDLLKEVSRHLQNHEVLENFKGNLLSQYTCDHPLYERESVLVHGDHVTTLAGTGLVHTAPGHGMEDFLIGKKHNLEPICPVDNFGRFTNQVPEFEGLSVLTEGTEAVMKILEEKNKIIAKEDYNHKYPYDWRSKKPVIIRSTSQWFATVEKLKEDALKSIENINIYPPSGRNRLQSFIEKRNEWCISRQRNWGVPIPVFYNKANGDVLATTESIEHIISLVREHGTNCWWELSTEELLAPKYRNDGNEYERGTDTLDVWFDSGSSWYSVLKERGIKLPADVYLEGSDQHRGWFQSSLLTSVALTNKSPYTNLITHGFVLDENGRKMSKSLGNMILPSSIVHGGKDRQKNPAYGADVLRLWIASADYTKDILIGPNVISIQFDLYKKIRNTTKFMLGNLSNFSKEDFVPYNELRKVDQYILHQMMKYAEKTTRYYDEFEFYKVHQLIRDIVHVDLSSFYLDVIKDRLYAEPIVSQGRKSSITTIFYILDIFVKSFAPILCHLAEDVYQNHPLKEQTSFFETGWMHLKEEWKLNEEMETAWVEILNLKHEVNKLIEKERTEKKIGSSFATNVEIEIFDKEKMKFLELFTNEDLEEIFSVSKVTITKNDSDLEYSVKLIEPTDYKCVRCWKFTSKVEHQVCERCHAVLNQ
eukprot:gene2005-1512_t